MPLNITTVFDGIDQSAVNWIKHYLTPGDSVALPWSGICDSVTGETYKYSNQFEYALNIEKFKTLYAYYSTMIYDNTHLDGIDATCYSTSFDVSDKIDHFTLWRLPLPDLPAILIIHLTEPIKIQTSTYNTIGLPIFDPNWDPTMITAGANVVDDTSYHVIHCGVIGSSTKLPNYCFGYNRQVYQGFSSNLTGYRLAGASVTIENVSSNMYKNGTIVAASADTPLSRPFEDSDVYTGVAADPTAFLSETAELLRVNDAPLTFDRISSIKNYKKFTMNEGCYLVLHNLQGEFLFRNPENIHKATYSDGVVGRVAYQVLNTDATTQIVMIMVVNEDDSYNLIPLVYDSNQHRQFYNSDKMTVLVPRPYIDPSSLSLWNHGYIAFKSTDINNSLSYTLKFNQYVECYVASQSPLKPNVTKSSKYYPQLIEYTSQFYQDHDGIYRASDNDSGRVWTLFKNALGDVIGNYAKTTPIYPLISAAGSLIKDLGKQPVQAPAPKNKGQNLALGLSAPGKTKYNPKPKQKGSGLFSYINRIPILKRLSKFWIIPSQVNMNGQFVPLQKIPINQFANMIATGLQTYGFRSRNRKPKKNAGRRNNNSNRPKNVSNKIVPSNQVRNRAGLKFRGRTASF